MYSKSLKYWKQKHIMDSSECTFAMCIRFHILKMSILWTMYQKCKLYNLLNIIFNTILMTKYQIAKPEA